MSQTAAAQVTGNVSVSSTGARAVGGDSADPSISDDGRFTVFASSATNLVEDDTNGVSDIFVHDRHTRTTRLISRSAAGVPGDGSSVSPTISADGTTVAFVSSAANLASGAALPAAYVHHLASGVTALISLPTGRVADLTLGHRRVLSLSGTGRHVAVSIRNPNDPKVRSREVLVLDRETSGVERVYGSHGSLSADGRFLAYDSMWVGGSYEVVTASFVLIRDRTTATAVNVNPPPGSNATECGFPAISADGRWTAFECHASHGHIYLHDKQAGVTTRVSTVPSGFSSGWKSLAPDISGDGRYVVFNSLNQLTGHPAGGNQVFRYDRVTGALTLLSASTVGEVVGFNVSFTPTVSGDGQTVAFASSATHFVLDDINGSDDVFIVDPTCTYAAPAAITLPAEGGTVPLTVSTNPACAWVAHSPQSWIGLTTSAGVRGAIGSAQLSVTAALNATGVARSVVLNVAGRSVSVTQASASCTVTVTPATRVVPVSGRPETIQVSTSYPFCDWTAVSDASWLTPSPLSGPGSRTVLFIVPANTTPGPRSGTITIAGTPVVVAQSGTACALGVNPTRIEMHAGGGSSSIAVTSSLAACPWANDSAATWVTVTPVFGQGNGTVSYEVLPNTTGAARTTTLAIAGYGVFVSQAATDSTGSPSAPVGLTATVEGNAVTLRWGLPTSGSAPTGYTIEVGSAPGLSDLAVLPTGNTAIRLTTGAPNGTYYIRVRATSPQGTSGASNEVVVQVGCAGPPAAATALSHSVSGAHVSLSWNPVSGATGYVLEAGSGTQLSNLATIAVAGPGFVAQAPPGVYFVRVRTRNACGLSAASRETVVIVGSAVSPPGVPFGLVSVVNGHGVALTWSAPTTGGSPTGYVLEAGSTSGSANLAQVTLGLALSFAADGVPSGTYYVRVRAINGASAGPASNEIVLVVP